MEHNPIHPAEEMDNEAKAKAAHDLHMPILKKMLGMPEKTDGTKPDTQKASPEQNN
jgi:hypothetical protein